VIGNRFVQIVVVFIAAVSTAFIAQPQPVAEPEIVILPEGFNGTAYVVFDIETGAPPDRDGSARVYRIPATGVLFTQDTPNEGQQPITNYFIESSTGVRVRIERVWHSTVPDTAENRRSTDVEVFYPVTGSSGVDAGCQHRYHRFSVGRRSRMLEMTIMRDREEDPLAGALRQLPPCQTPIDTASRAELPPRSVGRRMIVPHDGLTFVFATWAPGPSPLRVKDFGPVNLLLPPDEYVLSRAVEGGRIEIVGGSGKPDEASNIGRMFILFKGPLNVPVRLAQPDGMTVVYVQEDNNFRLSPPGASLRDRFVQLDPQPNDPRYAHYWIESVSGGRSGGSIAIGPW